MSWAMSRPRIIGSRLIRFWTTTTGKKPEIDNQYLNSSPLPAQSRSTHNTTHRGIHIYIYIYILYLHITTLYMLTHAHDQATYNLTARDKSLVSATTTKHMRIRHRRIHFRTHLTQRAMMVLLFFSNNTHKKGVVVGWKGHII